MKKPNLTILGRLAKHHARKIKKHPAFSPCQAVTQVGLLAMQWDRSTIAECCFIGSAILFVVVAVLGHEEIPDFE